jgi:hypothetical protein
VLRVLGLGLAIELADEPLRSNLEQVEDRSGPKE